MGFQHRVFFDVVRDVLVDFVLLLHNIQLLLLLELGVVRFPALNCFIEDLDLKQQLLLLDFGLFLFFVPRLLLHLDLVLLLEIQVLVRQNVILVEQLLFEVIEILDDYLQHVVVGPRNILVEDLVIGDALHDVERSVRVVKDQLRQLLLQQAERGLVELVRDVIAHDIDDLYQRLEFVDVAQVRQFQVVLVRVDHLVQL